MSCMGWQRIFLYFCENTKLWHLSSFALYSLLKEELETGKITWPEEQ